MYSRVDRYWLQSDMSVSKFIEPAWARQHDRNERIVEIIWLFLVALIAVLFGLKALIGLVIGLLVAGCVMSAAALARG